MSESSKKVTVNGRKYVWSQYSAHAIMSLDEYKGETSIASVSFRPDDDPPFRWRVDSDRIEPDSPISSALPGWCGEENSLQDAINMVYEILPKREKRKIEISGDMETVLSEMKKFMDG